MLSVMWSPFKVSLYFIIVQIIWVATWQNQQTECAHSKDSDQPGHPPRLIRVFAVCMKKVWVLSYPLSALQRLIRLGRCPGWSESSLGEQSFCWFCNEAAQMSCGHPLLHDSADYIYILVLWDQWAHSQLFGVYSMTERSAGGKNSVSLTTDQ